MLTHRPCVLVFAGMDPSGGAGIAADVQAIGALEAHALPVVTALTVQDNERVHEVLPVDPAVVARQAQAVLAACRIGAVKIGIPGSADNARAIAAIVAALRRHDAALPVVLDPVLASGHGDMLTKGDAVAALAPLLPLATVLTPNGPEAAALAAAQGLDGSVPDDRVPDGIMTDAMVADDMAPAGMPELAHARALRRLGCGHVLVTGGHGAGDAVVNRWFGPQRQQDWTWPRLPGAFHGSGCTLAAAIAALLARGDAIADALGRAQAYTHRTLAASYAIAPGQRIPLR